MKFTAGGDAAASTTIPSSSETAVAVKKVMLPSVW